MKRLVTVLALLLLVGCRDAAGPEQPFQQTITGSVAAFGVTEHALTTSRAGTLRVVLSWANAAIDLDLYLTAPTCTGYPPVQCEILAISDAEETTTETVERQVASGQQYKIWVDNFHETLGSNYTIQVTIQ